MPPHPPSIIVRRSPVRYRHSPAPCGWSRRLTSSHSATIDPTQLGTAPKASFFVQSHTTPINTHCATLLCASIGELRRYGDDCALPIRALLLWCDDRARRYVDATSLKPLHATQDVLVEFSPTALLAARALNVRRYHK